MSAAHKFSSISSKSILKAAMQLKLADELEIKTKISNSRSVSKEWKKKLKIKINKALFGDEVLPIKKYIFRKTLSFNVSSFPAELNKVIEKKEKHIFE